MDFYDCERIHKAANQPTSQPGDRTKVEHRARAHHGTRLIHESIVRRFSGGH